MTDTNPDAPPLPVRAQLKADLLKAMKARDKVSTATIRTMLGAIDNAEAVPLPPGLVYAMDGSSEVARRDLSEADIHAILIRERDERRRTLEKFQNMGLTDDVARVQGELEVFSRYLGDA